MALQDFLGNLAMAMGQEPGGTTGIAPTLPGQSDPRRAGLPPEVQFPMAGPFVMGRNVSTPGFNPNAPDPRTGQAPPSMPGATPQQDSGTKKFLGISGDTLGQIGDYLLQANDMAPIYAPRKAEQEKRQMGEALSQYLGQIDPQLGEMARQHPELAYKLLGVEREDKRFERTAGQDDRRIGISEGQLGLGERELAERVRSNQAGEGITARGQDISSGTQVKIAQMQQQSQALGRAHEVALARQDHERAKELLTLKQGFDREIALLGGGDAYEETVVETEGSPARDGWFSDTPATPSTKTVTRRPLASQGAPTQADLEFTAQKHGITVEEVKRRLGVN